MKLNAKQLRVSKPRKSEVSRIKRREIYIICDNILDAFNIGSIFRLADAVAAAKIYLCGQTQTPPYHRISKAAVGTDKWVPWEHIASASEAISDIKNQISNINVVAIEQGKGSVDYRIVGLKEPIAFVIGHETAGVSKDAVKAADCLIEIPMFGVNKSLNAVIALAMVLTKVVDTNF